MIEDYLRKRPNLVLIFILVDSRHSPQKIDLDFVNKLGEWGIPFAIVFTKTDKVTQRIAAKNVSDFLQELKKTWEAMPPHFVTSSLKKTGRQKLLAHIAEGNRVFNEFYEGQKF